MISLSFFLKKTYPIGGYAFREKKTGIKMGIQFTIPILIPVFFLKKAWPDSGYANFGRCSKKWLAFTSFACFRLVPCFRQRTFRDEPSFLVQSFVSVPLCVSVRSCVSVRLHVSVHSCVAVKQSVSVKLRFSQVWSCQSCYVVVTLYVSVQSFVYIKLHVPVKRRAAGKLHVSV